MHHAFLISEVFSCIIGYFAEDTVRHPTSFYARDTRKDGRRALTALAGTCRALSGPALDALWRRLHSLRPLMLCLPAKASYDDATVDGALPAFDDEEWNILSRYTPRVQELTLQHDQLSIKILQSLWFRTILLLPNLRKLHWIYEDYTMIASIRLLLSPSLVHLHVWLDGGDHSAVLGLLECYHTLCPNLKSLYFGHLCRFPHVTTAVSRAITRSPNLEALTCDPVDEAALVHIANSRRLKKLNAGLLNYHSENLERLANYATSEHPPFENLRVLELRVDDLSSIIPYLKSHQQPFEVVSFDFRMLPTPEVFRQLFTVLGSTTRQGTLRRIRLLSLGLRKHEIPSQAVDFEVLELLGTFKKLHTLDLNLINTVSLSDDNLAQLVQAWPDLETFHLNQRSGWNYSPTFHTPTLRGLLLLVVRCPKLRNIGLCVDAMNIPSLPDDKSLTHNNVTRLSLANSPIQYPVERVAQFLHELFPSLTDLPAWIPFNGPPPYDYRNLWREVGTLIREIKDLDSSPESSDSET